MLFLLRINQLDGFFPSKLFITILVFELTFGNSDTFYLLLLKLLTFKFFSLVFLFCSFFLFLFFFKNSSINNIQHILVVRSHSHLLLILGISLPAKLAFFCITVQQFICFVLSLSKFIVFFCWIENNLFRTG